MNTDTEPIQTSGRADRARAMMARELTRQQRASDAFLAQRVRPPAARRIVRCASDVFAYGEEFLIG